MYVYLAFVWCLSQCAKVKEQIQQIDRFQSEINKYVVMNGAAKMFLFSVTFFIVLRFLATSCTNQYQQIYCVQCYGNSVFHILE